MKQRRNGDTEHYEIDSCTHNSWSNIFRGGIYIVAIESQLYNYLLFSLGAKYSVAPLSPLIDMFNIIIRYQIIKSLYMVVYTHLVFTTMRNLSRSGCLLPL